MPSQVFLIRHGETAWSISGQHTGSTDIPLTEQGEKMAIQLKDRLGDLQLDHVFTSPRIRARRTCELAGFASVSQITPDLAEWDYGIYEGVRTKDICTERPDWNVFEHGCPQGEMPQHISDRADRLIAHLRTLEGNIALFSHGHMGCVLISRWIGLPVLQGQHFFLHTASISILSYDANRPTVPRIMQLNSH